MEPPAPSATTTLAALASLLTLLVALSAAAERLVGIIKALPWQALPATWRAWLGIDPPKLPANGQPDWRPQLRQLLLLLLNIGAGILTVDLAQDLLPTIPGTFLQAPAPALARKAPASAPGLQAPALTAGKLLLLGLLASGGTSLWTSLLGYVNSVKEVKRSTAKQAQVRLAAAKVRVLDELRPEAAPPVPHLAKQLRPVDFAVPSAPPDPEVLAMRKAALDNLRRVQQATDMAA